MTEEKKELPAKRILEQTNNVEDVERMEFVGRYGTSFGKPDLLSINMDARELTDVVSPASWRFLKSWDFLLGFSKTHQKGGQKMQNIRMLPESFVT